MQAMSVYLIGVIGDSHQIVCLVVPTENVSGKALMICIVSLHLVWCHDSFSCLILKVASAGPVDKAVPSGQQQFKTCATCKTQEVFSGCASVFGLGVTSGIFNLAGFGINVGRSSSWFLAIFVLWRLSVEGV